MYSVETHKLLVLRRNTICCRTWFCWTEWDHPPSSAKMTPMLSERSLKWALFAPCCIRHLIPSSTAAISAQPMFCPLESQPSRRCQDSHCWPRRTLIPPEVDASTANNIWDIWGGCCNRDLHLASVRIKCPHDTSSKTEEGILSLTKGDTMFWKEVAKCEKDGRHERLSGITRLQCTSDLRMLSTSFLVTLWPGFQESSFFKNLMHFFLGTSTVCSEIFHWKPR